MRLIPILFLFLISCARPNYVTQSNGLGGGPDQKATACQAYFASRACVAVTMEVPPTETTPATFVFKTSRANLADGSPIVEDLPGEMLVMLWMPDMGHGSAPVKLQKLDVGTYRVTDAYFVMKGKWEIRFQLKAGNEVQDQAVISLTL